MLSSIQLNEIYKHVLFLFFPSDNKLKLHCDRIGQAQDRFVGREFKKENQTHLFPCDTHGRQNYSD